MKYTLWAILAGIIVGAAYPDVALKLGSVASFIIEIIKALAIPLLFFAISDAILQQSFRGSGILRLILVATINGSCAIAIGLGISNLFHPGTYLPLQSTTVSKMGEVTTWSLFQRGVSSPMIIAILSSIMMAMIFLFMYRSSLISDEGFGKLKSRLHTLFDGMVKVMGWIVHVVPLAVFASVAKSVGQYSFHFLQGLGAYLFFCLLGMLVHVVFVYHTWIIGVARISLGRFWKAAIDPVLYSLGINSSLATLPYTLRALRDLRVSDSSARLSACVGTNFNNDGILLYEVVAVLFLSQSYGHALDWQAQLAMAALCVVATVGVSGIPEAGVIALTLALGAVDLSTEHIPLLLTVDWIIARTRSAVNVLGDMTVAIGIDALSGKRFP